MKNLFYFLLAAVFCIAGAAVPDRNAFVPDLSTSDIYLPHLKRVPLSGWWYLKKVSSDKKNNPNDAGTVGKFFDPNLDDSQWPRDLVPNDIHVPFLMKLPKKIDWGGMLDALYPHTSKWGGVAWFRKSFTAPSMEKGERAILTFEEICGDIMLYVNGKMIGKSIEFIQDTYYSYKTARGPQAFDITSAIIPGKKNVIAIRFYMSGEPIRDGWATIGGLTGIVYLDVRPAAYTENILATTEADLSTVMFDSILSGSTDPKDTDGWTGEIFEWKSGKKAAAVKFGKPYTEDGLRFVSGKVKIPNAKCWSHESPFLYGIRVKNSRGEVAGVQRFGIRRVTVDKYMFLLNGKPVALRGMTLDGQPFPLKEHGWFYVYRTNTCDVVRKRFKMFTTDAAVNHVRTHSAELQRGAYDIFDEQGVLIADELGYPTMRIKSTRADMIDVKGIDGACDKNGKLRPEFVARTKSRIRRIYSHPCICMFSFGNEMRQYDNPNMRKLLNNLYDFYHKFDKQKRPTTNSSGRFWEDGSNVREMYETEKLDYIDTHDYTGSADLKPVAFCESVALDFIGIVRKYYGKNHPPIVNGETVYMAHHYNRIFNNIWKNESDLQPNWDLMLNMFEKWGHDERFLIYYWLRNWGMKNFKYHRPEGRGFYTEHILEAYRKCWPEYAGYEALVGPFYEHSNAWPFDQITFTKNAAFKHLVRANWPLIAIPDYIAPNRYTDETVKTNIHTVNNYEKALNDVVFEFCIEQNGKNVSRKTLNVGKLASSEKKIQPFEFKTPSRPGVYRIIHTLYADGKKEISRELRLNIRNRSDVFAPVRTTKKIALYDCSAVFGRLKPYSTNQLLEAFSIPFTLIGNFDQLAKYDILIIGTDSLDGKVQDGADMIRSFIKNGGRVLMFDQHLNGRIPFMPELKLQHVGPSQYSDILRFDHSAMRGLDQNDFFCWNQPDWAVYRSYITPLSKAALMIGGDSTPWGADHFAMITAHLKFGKGDLLMTQCELTKLFNVDSSAAFFARRLFETILDDKTRAEAQKFSGFPLPKSKPVKQKNALLISLKSAANMGFADSQEKDGKGGWTDQGPYNDLYMFPTGNRFFGEVPFQIINPAQNGGRSCVIQSGNPALKFKPESKPIAVNAKVKRLLFLHAGAWMHDKQLGEYIITCKSGRKVRLPLYDKDNITDWWKTGTTMKNADCVWVGRNRRSVVGVFLYEWNNPFPQEEISSVVLSVKSNAVIGLIGLTGEKL